MENYPARELLMAVGRPREGVIAVRITHKPTGKSGEAEAATLEEARDLAERRLDEEILRVPAR